MELIQIVIILPELVKLLVLTNMKKERGQGITELIFAIGVAALVLSGVVILIINSYGARNKSFDRKKAVELAEIVGERLLLEKKTNASEFWNIDSPYWNNIWGDRMIDSSYPGYVYTIAPEFSSDCTPNTDCYLVTIGVGWSGKEEKWTYFYRFFSK